MSESVNLLSLFLVSFQAVLPAFAWIAAGMVIRRIDSRSVVLFKRGEKFVFYIGMPVVLCLSAAKLDFSTLDTSAYLLAGVIAFTVVVVASYIHTGWLGYSLGHRGVVSQSAYRGNLAIIGLALCASAFGEPGMVAAAMPIALWTLLYNVIAVVLLGFTHGRVSSPASVAKGLATNPLILAIVIGAMLSVSPVKLPAEVGRAGAWLSTVVIPFALLCMGGSISLRSARESRSELMVATLWRLLVSPLVAVCLALAMGVRGVELGVLFLLLGGPAAVACHVMVTAVGGNGKLAANIVMFTTLLAPLTLSLGLFLLKVFSWV